MWIQNKLKDYVVICLHLLTFTDPTTVCRYVVISVEVFDRSFCVELFSFFFVSVFLLEG